MIRGLKMNKWQKIYCDGLYNGKVPKTKRGKEEFELLGNIKSTVTVDFPERNDKPARTDTYIVTEDDCDIPNGKISVSVLASNLSFWSFNGYKVTSQ